MSVEQRYSMSTTPTITPVVFVPDRPLNRFTVGLALPMVILPNDGPAALRTNSHRKPPFVCSGMVGFHTRHSFNSQNHVFLCFVFEILPRFTNHTLVRFILHPLPELAQSGPPDGQSHSGSLNVTHSPSSLQVEGAR